MNTRRCSTAHPSPIRYREHLRETVLVEPVYLDPSRPLQAVPPPFPPPHPPPSPSPSLSDIADQNASENANGSVAAPPPPRTAERVNDSLAPSADDSDRNETDADGDPARPLNWYATRVQTLLLVERKPGGKVIFRERDAYVLDDLDANVHPQQDQAGREEASDRATGRLSAAKPRWSGEERRYEFRL